MVGVDGPFVVRGARLAMYEDSVEGEMTILAREDMVDKTKRCYKEIV